MRETKYIKFSELTKAEQENVLARKKRTGAKHIVINRFPKAKTFEDFFDFDNEDGLMIPRMEQYEVIFDNEEADA